MSEQYIVPGDNDDYIDKNKAMYSLRLFVTGASPNSIRAIANTKKMCEDHLNGRYELEIIDIYQQPEMAELEQLLAVPMLMRRLPLPERRLIGDMSDLNKVLTGLEIKA
ncbi:circadian clock KaiB family protein [Mucilaginibacter sp. HMF5004]|uniref:circadian clock KaiB family protein n=1 Tax=Mucilaginibacter rivuli TaxID=2857527 RepID=UPI001C602A30|nr:circadian clock KaiB family protein [Mucilaginibacter rivuli]MBW4889342.1 circadian clock KaiB family protein [Mucilaginibacter rivuli]